MDFGIIIHYGVYSHFAYDDIKSARRRRIQNGSEWYYGRLSETGTFRPISGHQNTKTYHAQTHGDSDYFDSICELTTNPDQVREWVRVAKSAGATSAVLTTRHHDGVCLWNTATTARKSEMDICRVFIDECRRLEITPGFYYSWFEFGAPFTVSYFRTVCLPQLNELMTYAPEIMWFDGDWKMTQKNVCAEVHALVERMLSRGIQVNDRTGKGAPPAGCIRVFADRYIPSEPLDIAWQHVNTIGLSWGYNREQTPADFKSATDIRALMARVGSLGGRFLLNIGPMADGTICAEELACLSALA